MIKYEERNLSYLPVSESYKRSIESEDYSKGHSHRGKRDVSHDVFFKSYVAENFLKNKQISNLT